MAQIGYLFLMFPLAFDPVAGRLQDGVALTGGVLLAVRPNDPSPPPPLDVVVVDTFGASTAIGVLPSGTTYASFAASLVG